MCDCCLNMDTYKDIVPLIRSFSLVPNMLPCLAQNYSASVSGG